MLIAAVTTYLAIGALLGVGAFGYAREHHQAFAWDDWAAYALLWPVIVVAFVGYGLARMVKA